MNIFLLNINELFNCNNLVMGISWNASYVLFYYVFSIDDMHLFCVLN